MKLISSFGPNPRAVRMFMAEKGITLPMEDVDILGGDNLKEDFLKRNPGAQTPALELDDGSVVAETAVICEYLEEQHPLPALIGKTAEERAHARTWQRRVEFGITENMYNAFRFGEGYGIFKDRRHCIPSASAELKVVAQKKLEWLDGLMGNNPFICGNEMRFIDIALYCCMDFANGVGQPLNPNLKKVSAWFARMAARPSATTSLSTNWEQIGMRG